MEGLSRQDEHKAASSERPEPRAHMLLSVGRTARPEECNDMTEGVTACSHTEEAPDMDQYPPFEGLDR